MKKVLVKRKWLLFWKIEVYPNYNKGSTPEYILPGWFISKTNAKRTAAILRFNKQ